MERTKLKNALREAGLTQQQFAQQMGVNQPTVSGWITAKTDPYPLQIPIIRDILNSSDPHLFDIDHQEQNKGLKGIMEMLRRQFMEALAKIGGTTTLGDVNLALVSSPVVEAEEYLAQASASIDACWELLNHGSFSKVERILNTNIPKLKQLANTLAPYQGIAANLVVQAKIMQILLATRKLDFVARELYCTEAVHFGQLSGSQDILAIAQGWQGNTYTFCYCQPQRAIPIFNNVLANFNREMSKLTRSALYSNLSIAHAQHKDEKKAKNHEKLARDYAELARTTMPEHPELEPYHQCNYFGPSELDQMEGMTFLHLSKILPQHGYAQMAYDAFDKATSKQALDEGYLSGSLIKKADAACALGVLDHFIECLRRGLVIASKIGSLRRLSETHDVLSHIPEKWLKEAAIKNLQQDLAQVKLVVLV
jgi:transcriptional regulator with XRE-family HTH domain